MSAEVRVSYFAAARELCGTQSELVPMESPRTVRAFMTLLAARHARLAPYLPRMRLAVNGEIVDAEHSIAGGDEVAVLPPVAGGSGDAPAATPAVALCALRDVTLSVDEVLQALTREQPVALQ